MSEDDVKGPADTSSAGDVSPDMTLYQMMSTWCQKKLFFQKITDRWKGYFKERRMKQGFFGYSYLFLYIIGDIYISCLAKVPVTQREKSRKMTERNP